MPQHLISVDEAAALFGAVGAPRAIIDAFRDHATRVLDARATLGEETVIVTSLHGAHSGEPGVNLEIGAVRIQLRVKAAQKIALDLIAATEAAISDASVVRLLVDKFGLDLEHAALVLLDLREIRQGTRGVSWDREKS